MGHLPGRVTGSIGSTSGRSGQKTASRHEPSWHACHSRFSTAFPQLAEGRLHSRCGQFGKLVGDAGRPCATGPSAQRWRFIGQCCASPGTPVQRQFIHSFVTSRSTEAVDSPRRLAAGFFRSPLEQGHWRKNQQCPAALAVSLVQPSTDSFSTAFPRLAPQPLWATRRLAMDQGKCLKIKAFRKNQDKKRTAARRPRQAWREGIHSHFIHSKANRFRGQNPARRTNPERSGPAQRPCARQPPAHSPATGCAQGFRQIRWTTQAAAPITWRISCASASTRSTSVSQEHMKRAPPAPMKV